MGTKRPDGRCLQSKKCGVRCSGSKVAYYLNCGVEREVYPRFSPRSAARVETYSNGHAHLQSSLTKSNQMAKAVSDSHRNFRSARNFHFARSIPLSPLSKRNESSSSSEAPSSTNASVAGGGATSSISTVGAPGCSKSCIAVVHQWVATLCNSHFLLSHPVRMVQSPGVGRFGTPSETATEQEER